MEKVTSKMTENLLKEQLIKQKRQNKIHHKSNMRAINAMVLQQQKIAEQLDDSSSGEEAELEAVLERQFERLKQLEQRRDDREERRQRRAAAPTVHHIQDQRSIRSFAREILQENGQEWAALDAHYEQAEHDYSQLCARMQEGVHGLSPSKHQFAAALVAVRFPSQKLIMLQPPGTGKTRTILSYVYLYAQQHTDAKISVHFPNFLLKKQDEGAYDILSRILPEATQLSLVPGAFHLAKDHVHVLDEADHFLLDTATFDVTREAGWRVFGLTATPIKREISMEEHLLDLLGYRLTDSCIQPVHGKVGDLLRITAEEFLTRHKRPENKYACLVYIGDAPSVRNEWKNLARDAGLTSNQSFKDADYRNLRTDTVHLIKFEHTRGLDFNSEHGISLLIAAPLPHERALEQLMGRVGRYGQPCTRHILAGLDSCLNKKLLDHHEDVVKRYDRLVAKQ